MPPGARRRQGRGAARGEALPGARRCQGRGAARGEAPPGVRCRQGYGVPPAPGRGRAGLCWPAMAEKITMGPEGKLQVPDEPIIPFIEGDGTGVDIWPAAKAVIDAAVAKHGKKIAWTEVLAGEKAFKQTGDWLPEETLEAFREYLIGIKGPLTTPVGGGFRSLNVALRQSSTFMSACGRSGGSRACPSPVKHPELVDMVIFRENTEDIYAGLEVEEGTPEAKRLIEFLHDEFGWKVRADSGIGIKPISVTGASAWPVPLCSTPSTTGASR